MFDYLINMFVKPQLKQQDNRQTECGLGFKNIIIVDVGEEVFLAIADSWETHQIASTEWSKLSEYWKLQTIQPPKQES